MSRLLTIGVPTYNRAQLLDQQLAWLADAIKGYESECEIVISDNCSTDDTPEVIEKWRPAFGDAALQLNRNSENIGAIRNISHCINSATSKYVWTISDDDQIEARTVPYLLRLLTEHPDLTLVILNFSSRKSSIFSPTTSISFGDEMANSRPNPAGMVGTLLWSNPSTPAATKSTAMGSMPVIIAPIFRGMPAGPGPSPS